MKYTIENSHLKVEISSKGATIEKIINKKTNDNHYWDYDNSVWPRRTSVCFPICGPVAQGKYLYESKEYNMPQHGFLRELEPTSVVKTTVLAPFVYDFETNEAEFQKEHVASEKIVFEFKATKDTLAIYPFNFVYQVVFTLKKKKLLIDYKVQNKGQNTMYYSTGSHYTYSVPVNSKEKYDDYVIETDNKIYNLKDDVFDNGPIILTNDQNEGIVTLKNTKTNKQTKVECNNFPYTILWSKPGVQPFVCIEPWAGLGENLNDAIGDIANKKAILTLEPKQKEVFKQIITVK